MSKPVEVKVTYNLSEVDLVKKTGVLKIREEMKRSGHRVIVTLSGQLTAAIIKSMKDKKARKFVNQDFTSTLMSPSFDENPLKLVKFNHGEDKAPTFKLQLVTDKGFTFKPYINAMNKRVDKIVFHHWKPEQFIRFWTVDLIK